MMSKYWYRFVGFFSFIILGLTYLLKRKSDKIDTLETELALSETEQKDAVLKEKVKVLVEEESKLAKQYAEAQEQVAELKERLIDPDLSDVKAIEEYWKNRVE